jgi:hypothetical protein
MQIFSVSLEFFGKIGEWRSSERDENVAAICISFGMWLVRECVSSILYREFVYEFVIQNRLVIHIRIFSN